MYSEHGQSKHSRLKRIDMNHSDIPQDRLKNNKTKRVNLKAIKLLLFTQGADLGHYFMGEGAIRRKSLCEENSNFLTAVQRVY